MRVGREAGGVLTYWIGRPRVAELSFGQHPTAVGTVYDAVFRLNRWGWMDPGTCTLTIEWPQGSTFAKWNETPEPVSQGSFRPESVPATFYRPVTARERFDAPILVEPTKGSLDVFSGWCAVTHGLHLPPARVLDRSAD